MNLVYLRVTHVQRVPLLHFNHDAPDRPDIHPSVLVLAAEQYLRRALPQGHHFVRLRPRREPLCPCQPKVGQFDRGVLHVDEHVLRLEVAVDDAAFVALLEADQHLAGEFAEGLVVHLEALVVDGFFDVVDDVFF